MNIYKSKHYTYGRIAYPKYTTLPSGRVWGLPAFRVLGAYRTRKAAQAAIHADYERGLCVGVTKGSEILKTPGLFWWLGKDQDQPHNMGILPDALPLPDAQIGDRFECLGEMGTVTHTDRRRLTIEWTTEGTVYSGTSIMRSTLERGLELGTWALARPD